MTDLANLTEEQIAQQLIELNKWLDAREYAEYHATHIQGVEFDPSADWVTFPPEERIDNAD